MSTDANSPDSTTNFTDIAVADAPVAEALSSIYDEPTDVADRDPRQVEAAVNKYLTDQADDVDLDDAVGAFTSMEAEKVEAEGITNLFDLAQISVESLATETDVPRSKLRKAKQSAADKTPLINADQAERIINHAEASAPVEPLLAEEALDNWSQRTTSKIHSVEEQTLIDPTPIAKTAGYDSDIDPEVDPAVQYVSSLGTNESAPVLTGLEILDEPNENTPRLETDPDAGPDALPVDEDGNPIPPLSPPEPIVGHPIDELSAKTMARREPLYLYGEQGVGKNYILRYIAWYVNRGYVGIDCSPDMMPTDLFGPLSPDEDGKIVPRNKALKKALLGPNIVVLNEFPVIPSGTGMSIHEYLNEGKLHVVEHGEVVEPHPGAVICFTGNPPTHEYKDAEPTNLATRSRMKAYHVQHPQSVDDETETLNKYLNTGMQITPEDTLRKIVQFAHSTRTEDNWPTLSVRNLTNICDEMKKGVAPKEAVHLELWRMKDKLMDQDLSDAENSLENRL